MREDLDLKEGLYIPSIEACWLYKLNKETGVYKIDYNYLDKLLKGKLDWSFELIANEQLINNIRIKKIKGKFKDRLYTLDVINVKFTKKYIHFIKDDNGKLVRDNLNSMTTKELRNWAYTKGFKFNNNYFGNWKRTTGKARSGENLHIINRLRKHVLDWARMGLEFDGEVDIGSIRAYESLPLSSIIGTIEINPANILVINDFESKFPWTMSKTWLNNGELETETGETEECNSTWDGQGLLSKKIFDNENNKLLIKDKGVVLLRNRYMKCAGFNCDLELYYKDYCKERGLDYDSFEVQDINGNSIKVKDIELVTTPSAIKLQKANKQVLKIAGYENYGEGAWLEYWKDNCGEIFGVCKTDEPSHLCEFNEKGEVITYNNRLSYQIINTIPFKSKEITELFEPEKEYIEKLKSDLDFFLQEVNQADEELEINDGAEEFKTGKKIDVCGAFVEMAKKNSLFVQTQVFKDYRRNFIDAYKNKLRVGKLKIESADYAIACGNPIEMLLATTGDFKGKSVTLKGNELYCSRFKDGEDVVGFRNPHVVTANCGVQVNRKIELIDKYMNGTPNIVYLNSIDYPILSIYQGEDFDIDSNLLSNNPILVAACSRIKHDLTPIPVNRVKNTGKNDKEFTQANMSDVDHIISRNFIGDVINLSMELNSKMNHLTNTSKETEELEETDALEALEAELKELYNRASKCSSISCVEIDKAKKQFNDLDVPKELEKMKKGFKTVGENDARRIKPYFFKYIGDNSAKQQRKLTEKKHKKALDDATKAQFAEANKIDMINLKDKELTKLLKANNKIHEEWVGQQYVKMETPMDWLQEEIDNIENKKKIGTIQVIKLVKKIKHKANEEVVNQVVAMIKKLNTDIKGYKLDLELKGKEKKDKITNTKRDLELEIREMKLSKTNMYGILKVCLNSLKKNGKIHKKSGIESIALKVLFGAYGTGFLDMFVVQGGDFN